MNQSTPPTSSLPFDPSLFRSTIITRDGVSPWDVEVVVAEMARSPGIPDEDIVHIEFDFWAAIVYYV